MSVVDVDCAPLFSPGRDLSVGSRGWEVAGLAELLGWDLMPWQRHVLDVALEVDGRGVPVFRSVVVSVPRQCGKTVLLACLCLHRMVYWSLGGGAEHSVFTAQSLREAAQMWELKVWPEMVGSELVEGAGIRMRRSNDNWGFFSSVTGGSIRVMSSSRSAGHGSSLGLAVLDEAWDISDASREQAFLPAMRAVGDAQFWVVSTAGDVDSSYLWGKVKRGRELVRSGRCRVERVAFFEWGLPSGEDWELEENWARAVPALGFTVGLDDLRHERSVMDELEFRRAALNQWPPEEALGVVPWDRWVACRSEDEPSGVLWVGLDAPQRSRQSAGVVVCGGGVVEVVRTGGGLHWAGRVVEELWGRWGEEIGGFCLNRVGPLRALGEVLEARGLPVRWYNWSQVAGACERFYDAMFSGGLRVRAHPGLDAAVRGVGAVDRLSGSWVWKSAGDRSISALLAATLAFDADCWWREQPPVPEVGWGVGDWDGDVGYEEWLEQAKSEGLV